jgi:hypothetical protein
MFYASLCQHCLTGLIEQRFSEHSHSREECKAFQALRKRAGLPVDRTLDQAELRKVIAYEKHTGKLPGLAEIK